jgi:sirohydrochlorin ferrochelatase
MSENGPVGDYEFRQLSLPRGTSRNVARRLLTDAAEHEGWELARLRLYPDGRRHVVLRRRVLRVARTL